MRKNRFNLVDEPWIPVADAGRISLKELFSNDQYKALGGNPVQKLALTKMLLAIVQAAATPEDDYEWGEMGVTGMATKALTYLDRWYDRFWLYGEKPFLQMPAVEQLIKDRTKQLVESAKSESKRKEAIEKGLPKSFGAGFYPDLPSDNNTMLSHTMMDREMKDAEKAVFVVCMMNFSLGGKRVEGDVVSLGGEKLGNRYSGKSGPSLGNYVGYLHSLLVSDSIQSTLWMNVLTTETINNNKQWTEGVGVPPWEKMPESENCKYAQKLTKSYMACLVAMSKFIYLRNRGLYYFDGIRYPSHKEGWREPSMSVNESSNPAKMKWIDLDTKPWRELPSILSFMDAQGNSRFTCMQIANGLYRGKESNYPIGVWSGGLRVRGTSGDQSVKQDDDFVESVVHFDSVDLGANWFSHLEHEMGALETVAKQTYGATMGYYKSLKMDGKNIAGQATHLFWELVERDFQNLIEYCDDLQEMEKLRQKFAGFSNQAFNRFCTRETARQLDAWAANRPNLLNYLNPKKEKAT